MDFSDLAAGVNGCDHVGGKNIRKISMRAAGAIDYHTGCAETRIHAFQEVTRALRPLIITGAGLIEMAVRTETGERAKFGKCVKRVIAEWIGALIYDAGARRGASGVLPVRDMPLPVIQGAR